MSEDTKQPATEKPDPAAAPAGEGSGAPEKKDDFEAALNEYEAADGSSSEQQKPKTEAKADDETLSRLKRLENEQAERVYREDLGKVIGQVRGDFAADEVDDEFIDSWLNAQAKKDARIAQAWAQRHDDPAKFKRVVKGLTQAFAEKHARLRKQAQDATDTKEVVAHAVQRGQTKPSPGTAPDYSKMNDAEFREAVKKEHGFSPI